jgi:hypothetical protein
MKNLFLQSSRTLCALFFGFMLTAMLTNNVHAQIGAYSFAQSTSSYTEITGGTVIATATTNSGATGLDDVNYAVNFAPFSFTYDGTAYTNLNLNSNGYITFGATLPPTGTPYTPISSAVAYAGAVSAFGGDIIGFFNLGGLTSQLRWEIVGTAPNRELVLQWKDFRPNFSTSTTLVYRVNFQIRLKENGNAVEVVYGPSGVVLGSPTASGTRQVGLRGAANTAFNNRTNTTLVAYTASTAGGANTATQAFNIVGATPGMPSNGLTYTWTPPLPCTSPIPGNTTGPALACSGIPFNLGLQNATPGSGVSYQWFVSTVSSGGPWTPVGPNAAVYAATQTVQSWYYCVVTCNVGPSSSGSSVLQVGMDVPTNCYCLSTGTSANTQITNVTVTGSLSTLNNTSAGNAGYVNFTSVAPTVSSYPGDVVSFSVTCTSDPGRSIFIDWNSDGIFDVPAERMYTSAAYATGASVGSFNVPLLTPAGSYRMRVVANWLGTTPAPCNTAINGETEDYSFVVAALLPCAGSPTPGNTLSSTVTACALTNFTLSLQNATSGTGVLYQWQSSPDDMTWTDFGAGGTTQITSLLANTYYRCLVNCTASLATTASNSVLVTLNSNACQCTPSPICASNTTNLTDEWISGVTFAGINNPSGSTGYSDFRCVQGTATAGSTYSFTANITNGSASAWTETVRLYIDWNQDNAFGAGEVFDIGSASVPAGSTVPFSNTICVPYNAVTGVTNMRVYLKFSTYAAATGCEVTSFGEVEDYWLNVLPPAAAPANDLCANAAVLTPMVANVPYGLGLPAQTTVLGTLYGAVGANAPLCGGNQDVFYTLTTPYENHYTLTVNPFGGADVSIELLSACGGASLALINDNGAGQAESDVFLNVPAGTYIIRVIGQATSPAQGQFLINVQAAPVTKVMDGTGCNATGLQLEDVIRCNLVAGALDYEWRFVEVGGGLDATYVRGSNNRNLRLSWIDGIDYNKLYNVYVRAQFNLPGAGVVWGAYRIYGDVTLLGSSDCTVETGVSVTPTQVQPAYSPNSPLTSAPYALCNNVRANYVAAAEQYEWEFSGSPSPNCAQAQGGPGFPSNPGCESAICTIDPFCCSTQWDGLCATAALSEPACASCASVYCDQLQQGPGFASNPACEAAVCGIDAFCCSNQWDGLCASEATLQPACASCLTPVNSAIYVTSPSYFIPLSNVPGIQMNTIYQVRVRARVNGLWGTFGVSLPVALGLPANTSIWLSHCNTVRPPSGAGSNVAAFNVCAAQSYTFRFQHVSEPERIVVRPTYVCPFNTVVPALTPGQTYTVSVKVTQGGVPGDYSTSCPITIAGPGAEGIADDVAVTKVLETGNLGIYPNPNAGTEVRVDLNGIADGYHDVAVTIYDIYGKLMTRDVFGHQGAELSRLVRFEQELATGMYLVHVTIDGETFATEKMVVK